MSHEPSAPTADRAGAGLIAGIALVSAATLGVQVLQTRLFSVMLWHHLTYMVVTVTLLGFAAGGSLLAVLPALGRVGGDSRTAVGWCSALFGLTLVGAFALLAHQPLDTLDIEEDRTKYFFLFLHYAYLVVPFVFAGMAIAIALQQFGASVHRTYFWNLIGSGIGSFLFVLLVRPLGAPALLFLFAAMGGVGALASVAGVGGLRGLLPRLAGGLSILGFVLAVAAPGLRETLVPVVPARSKAQSLSERIYPLLVEQMRALDPDYQGVDDSLRRTIWTPLCRLDTVPMPPVLEHAKQDRLEDDGKPRSQVHVFQDGDAPTVIWSREYAEEHDYDAHFYGLGYELVDEPRVLIIGPGGGNDVETALAHGAKKVTAVDINGDTLRLVREDFKDYTGDVYGRPGVEAVHSEGRSYLRRAGGEYDLLQMSGTDTYAALSSGSYIFSESYLYTEEAFDDFFAHLSDKGVISVIRFRFEPPRETLKLVATAGRALQRLGIEDLTKHFIVVDQTDAQIKAFADGFRQLEGVTDETKIELARMFNEPLRYSFTLMRKTPFTQEDVDRIERALAPLNTNALVDHRIAYRAGHADQPDSPYGRLLAAISAGAAAERQFYDEYAYDVEPATDDRPFFFLFHSWSELFEESQPQAAVTGNPEDDSGYVALTGEAPIGLYILAALAVQTAIATLLLVILPLFRLGFRPMPGGVSRGRMLLYFGALGVAYLLVEITTIQRFVLFLGHPTYSLTVGLASFLVFSGLGAATAGKLQAGPRTAATAAAIVVALLVVHALAVPDLLDATLAASEAARVGIAAACIAPLAFAMGMPFPTGLALLKGERSGTVAWAFGVNGAASVVSSVISILLAMEFGFTVVFGLAALLYLIAACTVPRTQAAAA